MSNMHFPPGFVWGAATASYQIEGATSEDGRGASIWDTFSRTPGKVFHGDTGDVADDHYHLWRDDIRLMQQLGIGAYRFSVAWPRVIPKGAGAVNAAGLDFYDRLVDGLVAAKITPFVTLYHWDLPQALQDAGGWANPATVDAFVAYAEAVAKRLGDRVKHWITHNEPWVVAYLGNREGVHAPGLRDLATAVQVSHHLLVSHGRAVPVLRACSPGAKVGITLNLSTAMPYTPTDADRAAAVVQDGYLNRWFLDPIFGRGYPSDMVALYGKAMPPVTDADLRTIAAPIDFLGVNNYFPEIVKAVPVSQDVLGCAGISTAEKLAAGHTLTKMEWVIVPSALQSLLERLTRDYAPAEMYITENGAAVDDHLVGGKVEDSGRINYLREHIGAVGRAIANGAPMKGYFVWSLLDNFEWVHGFGKRFGIVFVDYATQRRIPKASFEYYSRIVKNNALVWADG